MEHYIANAVGKEMSEAVQGEAASGETMGEGSGLAELGDGTEGSPFLIGDVLGFLKIEDNLSAFYRLTGDLDFAGQGITPMGSISLPFKGGLDGGGYVIRNFKINASDSNLGLFRCAREAKLKNLVLEKAEVKQAASATYAGVLAGHLDNCILENIKMVEINVEGSQYAGALTGYVGGGSITGCSVKGTGLVSGSVFVGGLIGSITSGSVLRCYADIEIRGGNYTGGLIGNATGNTTTINECYAIKNVTGKACIGGLIGYLKAELSNSFARGDVTSATNHIQTGGLVGSMMSSSIKNCYAAGKISANGSGLGDATTLITVTESYFDSVASGITTVNKYNVGKLTMGLMRRVTYTGWDFDSIWDITEGRAYPCLQNVEKPEEKEYDTSSLPVGGGREEDPYVISTVGQFAYIRNELSGYYRLATDIDVNGGTITPFGSYEIPFSGGLDGNGYAIKNFRIHTTDSYTGLFRYAKAAKLKNLLLENGEVTQAVSASYAGALAGSLYNCMTENISLLEVSIGGGQYVGSLTGFVSGGSVTACSVKGTGLVSGTGYVGGLIGSLNGAGILHCFADIESKGGDYTGGLIGSVSGTTCQINECYAVKGVTGKGYVGGLIGYLSAALSNSFAAGDVTSTSNNAYTGGLLGGIKAASIKNCYAVGKISANGSGLGCVINTTTVLCSYFDGVAAGTAKVDNYNVGKLTTGLMRKAAYTGWDFNDLWDIAEGRGFPFLRSMAQPEWKEANMDSIPLGAGTEDEPYLIHTLEELAYMKYELCGYYKLAADMDAKGGLLTPFGSSVIPFTGGLDGAGYSVRNFRINTTDSYTGLFRYARAAKLKNLMLVNGEITQAVQASYIGALAGYLDKCITENISLVEISINGGVFAGALSGHVSGGSVTECSVKGTGLVSGTGNVGGLVGRLTNGSILRCHANIEARGGDYTGGLVGDALGSASQINECYAIKNVTGKGYVGGLIGYLSVALSNCFAAGDVESTSNSNYTGGLSGFIISANIKNCYAMGRISTNGSGLGSVNPSATIADSYFDSVVAEAAIVNSYNVGKLTTGFLRKDSFTNWDFNGVWDIEEERNFPYLRNVEEPEWDEVNTGSMPMGAGTEKNPYLIHTAEQLAYIKYELTGHYRLAADLDMNGGMITSLGTSVTPFMGGFDGDGYAIKNFRINATDKYAGLFRYAKAAKMKNLLLEKGEAVQTELTSFIGALAGYLDSCTVENISLLDLSITGGQYSGGMAGSIYGGSVKGCSVTGSSSVKGTMQVGGLAGMVSNVELRDCLAEGEGMVSGVGAVGGLAGNMVQGTVECCYAAIETKGSDYTGGLLGRISGTTAKVNQCYGQGNITGKTYVGGLIGHADTAAINDSFAAGNVTSTANSMNTGGLIGYAISVKIKNCYAVCSISKGGCGLANLYNGAQMTSSYFNSTLAGITTPTNHARTTEQMANKITYFGWDWKNIWNEQMDSVPRLKNMPDFIHQVPFDLTFSKLTFYSIALIWPDLKGAEEYEISYEDTKRSSRISNASIVDLIQETDYEFRARAKMGSIKGVWSRPLRVRTKKMALLKGLHSIGKGKNHITFMWNPVEDARGYEVVYNGEHFVTQTNTCTITGLYADMPYFIMVRALVPEGNRIVSSPVRMKIYELAPQTEYALAFMKQCEGQVWFMDEIENLLNVRGKSINTIQSQKDFATIYAIGLADRGISGEIPTAIGELFALQYLYLGNNDLGGKLPDEILSLEHLVEVDLSGNHFLNEVV